MVNQVHGKTSTGKVIKWVHLAWSSTWTQYLLAPLTGKAAEGAGEHNSQLQINVNMFYLIKVIYHSLEMQMIKTFMEVFVSGASNDNSPQRTIGNLSPQPTVLRGVGFARKSCACCLLPLEWRTVRTSALCAR